MVKKLSTIVFAVLILTGCTVTQTLSMTSPEGGFSEGETKVDPFFTTLLEDFSTIAPTTTQYSLMEEAMISFASSIAESENAGSVTLLGEETGREFYLSFTYSDLVGLVSDLEKTGRNTVLEAKGNTLSFHLSMDNYLELKDAIPFLSDPNFEVYGPEYSNGMTEDEYKEMIWFMLGDEGPDALDKGSVTLDIKVPGTIAEAEGVYVTGEDTARFSFPIISFLLLNDPLSFSISWN